MIARYYNDRLIHETSTTAALQLLGKIVGQSIAINYAGIVPIRPFTATTVHIVFLSLSRMSLSVLSRRRRALEGQRGDSGVGDRLT